MPYRFEPGEDVPVALRRCAREQLDEAIHQLARGGNPAEAIHEARKALKKERSLLRLAAGSLPAGRRRRENAALRAIAQSLGSSRDADAMIEALDRLSDRYSGQVPHATFAAVRARLERERDQAGSAGEDARTGAVEELRSVRERIDGWPLRGHGWPAIEPGLSRAYAGGRKAIRHAQAHPTVERLHEARKRSKDLWYQLRLLRSACPEMAGGHAKLAHRLTQLLGDDHDLVLLRASLKGAADELTVDLEALAGLVEHRRHALQGEAFEVAAACYAEQRRAFLTRMRRYWKAFEAHDEATAASRPAELAELTRHHAAA